MAWAFPMKSPGLEARGLELRMGRLGGEMSLPSKSRRSVALFTNPVRGEATDSSTMEWTFIVSREARDAF